MKAILSFLRNEYVRATCCFLLTTFVFFRPNILHRAYFWDDFIEQVYPNRVYAGKSLSKGEFPHWNPYSFCGMPFQADVQTALYYPPHMLFDRFIGAHNQNGAYYLQLLIILHFVIAQLTMYTLARRLGISPTASGIAAVAYAFSAPLALHTHHPMFIEHLAWLPLVLVLLLRISQTGSIAAIGWAGIIGGMMLLSGAPQMSLYVLTFATFYVLWWSITSNDRWKIRVTRLISALIALVIAVGVFGIQYLPSRLLASQSERATLNYEQATEGSLEYSSLLTAFVPKAFGIVTPPGAPNRTPYFGSEQAYLYWDTAFYFGIGILVLGLWAAIAFWRDSTLVRFLSISSVAAFLFALGSNGFLYSLIYHLPFFGQVRIPARMMFVVVFAVSLLAAYGWDRLRTSLRPTQQRLLYAIISIAAIIVSAIGLGGLVSAPERIGAIIRSEAWGQFIFLLLIATAAILATRGVRTTWLGFVVAIVVFADLFTAHASFSYGRQDPSAVYRAALSDELRRILEPQPPSDIFRVSMRRPEIIALKRNQGLVDGIMLFEGYNQLLLARRHPAVSSAETVADLLAIRWAIGKDSIGRWSFLARSTAYPMVWLVHDVRIVTPDQVAQVMQHDTTLNYRSTAVIEHEPPIRIEPASSGDSVAIIAYSNAAVRYRVRCSAPALAVMSEIFYPEWNAYLDGERTPLLRANYCLRSVAVPAGEHTIELRYESSHFTAGSLITAAALAVALALVGVDNIRRIQRRRFSTEQR
ncbi:MAG: YfhO family protein [Chlorobi bacterium]|nr:YfhO family protein [Chlorobiota bacterium]